MNPSNNQYSNIQPCRYLIMAGGTGGHIFPAMAVAKELMSRGAIVDWLGAEQGMETSIVPTENIPLHCIKIKGFRGKGLLQKIMAPFLLCHAIFQAMAIIRETNSSVVVGFGGFVAAPGGIAARLLGRKLVIHEQNSVAGSTNRLLNKLANTTLEAFPKSLPHAVHVGNPVRSNITSINRDVSPSVGQSNTALNVLLMGGSLGAKAINDIAPDAFSHFAKNNINYSVGVWHQTGKGKKEPVTEAYRGLGLVAKVDEFIDDVAAAYAWADVVVCRAGALTVSEIAIVAVPAIFIPLPSAIDNHQYYNARWLVDNDAALLIEQHNLTAESLSQLLLGACEDREKLKAMRTQLTTLALPQATEQVANYCEALCTKKLKGTKTLKEASHAV